jgi:hypothetical protein
MDSNSVIVVLMVILITMAGVDLWRQYSINSISGWFASYKSAVTFDDDFWKLGFRLENLDIKLELSSGRLQQVQHVLNTLLPSMRLDKSMLRTNMHDFAHTRASRIAMHGLLMNDSAIYKIHCDDNEGNLLRVGLNDFRTDERDSCQIFTDADKPDEDWTGDGPSPPSFFEMVPLDEEAFALRPMGAHNFYVSAVPPPSGNEEQPWKMVVGSAVVGMPERFRIDERGHLYSHLMEGYFRCGGGQVVKGFPGSSTYSVNKFVLEQVKENDVRVAQELVSLSDQIKDIQEAEITSHHTPEDARKKLVNLVNGGENKATLRICMGVPMTSKGTKMKTVEDSPLWSNLFDSFMKSIDWRANKYVFRFYLGFDKGDDLYDTGDAWSDMRSEFHERAAYRMKEQLLKDEEIDEVLSKRLTLKLHHFDHLSGAPTQVVSQLMLDGYVDGYDYFYQVNDDTIIDTPNWPPHFINALVANPVVSNLGVTGPLDTNNDLIFTHAFVHRTHFEVFGHLFPASFKNWWSDDWISTVYGKEHTFHLKDVKIKHNVGAQKENGYTRYEVDQGAQHRLNAELRKGHVQIDEWLKKNSHPRMTLPAICGYIPISKFLYKGLNSERAHDNKQQDKEL